MHESDESEWCHVQDVRSREASSAEAGEEGGRILQMLPPR